MLMMKRFLLLFILSVNITAQSVNEKFTEGMTAFAHKEYLLAHDILNSVCSSDSPMEQAIRSTAFFFSAKALDKAGQSDGAVAEYEEFIRNFPLSEYRPEALYNLGVIYFKFGQYKKAREKFITLIHQYPKSDFYGPANYWVGESFVEQRRLNEAEEFLLQTLTKRKSNNLIDYSIYSLGNLYDLKGDYSKAVAYYDELLTYYADSELAPYAQLKIGISYFRLNDYENSVLELTDPKIAELPYELQLQAKNVLANAYFRLGEYDKSKENFRSILKEGSGSVTEDEIRYGLAWVNFQTEKYEDAYKIFHSLIASLEDSIRIKSLYWSAEAKRYQGKIAEAVKIYKQFLNLYPHDVNAFAIKFNLGIIFYNRKDYSKAERYLLEAIASPDSYTRARAFTLLGEIKLHRKKYARARDYFLQASSEDLTKGNLKLRSMLGLGIAFYYLNSFQKAIAILEELQKLDKTFERDKTEFYLAESYFALGNFKKALKHYNKIAPSAAMNVGREATYGRAYSYFNLKDFPNASYYFKEYLSRYPKAHNSVDAMFRLADSYFGMKQFRLASAEFLKILHQKGYRYFNPFEYYNFALSLYRAGNKEKAVKEFENLQTLYPKSKYAPNAQYLIGWIYFQESDFQSAINAYLQIPSKYPSSPVVPIAYYSIGDAYYNLGRYDEAISFYKSVLEDYPNSKYVFDAVNGIQYCYIAEGMPEQAIGFIDNYVAMNPTSEFGPDILFKKGDIYFSIGEYEKARVGYKEFIATYPKSRLVPNAYFWIGKSSLLLGQTADALYNFRQVFENYPKSDVSVSAIVEMSNIYNAEGKYEASLKLFDKALNVLANAKGVEEIIFLKGKTLLQVGQIQEAYKTFNEVIIYHDGTIFADKAKIEIGLLELERRAYESAEKFFKEIGTKRTDDIGAKGQYYYGLTLFEEGKIIDAISAFVRVRSVFSRYDEWYTKSLLKLGDCYMQLGDKKNAREMYRAVLKRHPKDEYGKEAKWKLRRL